jgi:PAS domain S-box-containing protein
MEKFVQVIGINEDNCTNCHQCIAVCPVKICSDGSGEVIKFNNNRCIACGRCVEACIKSHGGSIEKSARFIIDDAAEFAANLGKREIVALIAPSAASNFELPKLISALKKLGVNKAYDVSLGAEITVAAYHQAMAAGTVKRPLISTPCPAVTRYVELSHPGLLEYLAPIGSPVHNLAVYAGSLHPHAELALISPCLAKRREFQDSRIVKYNVTYQHLLKIFEEHGIELSSMEDSEFDNIIPAGITANFSTPGGLKASYLYHYPDTPASEIAQIEGPAIYEQYLGNLERYIRRGDQHLPLIVDVLSCEKGCNMGVGCINKKTVASEYRVAKRSEENISNPELNRQRDEFIAELLKNHDFSNGHYRDLTAQMRLDIPSDEQLQAIYHDMHKAEEKDFRNCAACGYNSCYYMAVAIFNGLNKIQNCHLYQEKQLYIEQQALRNVNEELINVFDTMSDGVLGVDKNGRVSQFNPAARQIIGYSQEALLGVHIVELFSGKAPKTMNLLQTGEAFHDQEIMLSGSSGKVHAAASGIPIFDEDQQVIGATIILRPIARVQELVNRFTGAQATFTFDSIIGEDKLLRRAVKLAMKAGGNNSTVLLQAESGTGKEVFAQAIHNVSARKNGPFVAINCAALPRELVGSELFGYVEGAFTGARRGGRPGKFELANHGTLLLDEIGDMPLEQQAVLLRALQEKAVLRVGGDSPIKVDVRIIAATNHNLPELVDQGRFRVDLYYRLNVVRINIPALRERPGDIRLLFNHFLKEMSGRTGRRIISVDDAVYNYLEAYQWPGNIRELQNVVERMLLVADDSRLTIDHLPREIIKMEVDTAVKRQQWLDNSSVVPPGYLGDRHTRKLFALEQEKKRIIQALDMHGGNISKAAIEMGISRSTLYRKMKECQIIN